jgi:hypothetical protein
LSLIWSSITTNSNDFVKPSVTPIIMLLIKDLYKPCFALWSCDQTICLLELTVFNCYSYVRKLLCKLTIFSFYCNTVFNFYSYPAGLQLDFTYSWHLIVYLLVYVTNYFTNIQLFCFSSHQTFWCWNNSNT